MVQIRKKRMTKDQKSLLLYWETRAVDHAGLVLPDHMNEDDFDQACQWNDSGFLTFRRRRIVEISEASKETHWVRFSSYAWTDVHRLRRERGMRNECKDD